MFKNVYFLEKTVKNRLSIESSAPEPPFVSGGLGLYTQTSALLLSPTITSLSSSFLALNAFYYPKKDRNNYSKSK